MSKTYLPLGRVGVMLDFFWIMRYSLRKVGKAAVRIHTMKSSLMKPLFSGSVGSNSYTGFLQFTGLFVPEKERDKTMLVPQVSVFMSLKDVVNSLLKSPWKATVRLLIPPGFLNFTCLSVHHAMPFFAKGIAFLVPLESIWYSSRVSERDIQY